MTTAPLPVVKATALFWRHDIDFFSDLAVCNRAKLTNWFAKWTTQWSRTSCEVAARYSLSLSNEVFFLPTPPFSSTRDRVMNTYLLSAAVPSPGRRVYGHLYTGVHADVIRKFYAVAMVMDKASCYRMREVNIILAVINKACIGLYISSSPLCNWHKFSLGVC